jgi:hypothetical protein
MGDNTVVGNQGKSLGADHHRRLDQQSKSFTQFSVSIRKETDSSICTTRSSSPGLISSSDFKVRSFGHIRNESNGNVAGNTNNMDSLPLRTHRLSRYKLSARRPFPGEIDRKIFQRTSSWRDALKQFSLNHYLQLVLGCNEGRQVRFAATRSESSWNREDSDLGRTEVQSYQRK